MIAACDSIKER